MAATLLNLADKITNPEEVVEIDPVNNTKTVKYSYEIDDDLWESSLPDNYSTHPRYTTAKLVKITAALQPGRVRKVTLSYSAANTDEEGGGGGGGGAARIRYEKQHTVSEEPLLSHPDYDALPEEEREALVSIFGGQRVDEDGVPLKDALVTAASLQAYSKYLKGQTSYRAAKKLWIQHRTLTGFENDAHVGKIDTPPGNPPTGAGKNWLNMGGTAAETEDASAVQESRTWEESAEGGWDADTYS